MGVARCLPTGAGSACCGALAETDKLRTGVGASVDELAEDDADELGNWP